MAEKKSSRKIILPIILGAIVIGGLIYGGSEYIYSLHHETTDDAQIDGDINPVVTRVTGYVDSIFFEENQLVKKGQVLVKLDDRDLAIKVEQAQAALDNAIAGVSVARANVSTTQANNGAVQANVENAKIKVWKATQDYNRYESLLHDGSITQQQFDAARAEKESAEAQLRLAEKQLTTGQVQTECNFRTNWRCAINGSVKAGRP
jgi:membrane fusion protein (multidrug efflux system)